MRLSVCPCMPPPPNRDPPPPTPYPLTTHSPTARPIVFAHKALWCFGEFEFGARLWDTPPRDAPSLFVHVWRCSRVFNLINFVKFKANTKRSALCQKKKKERWPTPLITANVQLYFGIFVFVVRALGRGKFGHSPLRVPALRHPSLLAFVTRQVDKSKSRIFLFFHLYFFKPWHTANKQKQRALANEKSPLV